MRSGLGSLRFGLQPCPEMGTSNEYTKVEVYFGLMLRFSLSVWKDVEYQTVNAVNRSNVKDSKNWAQRSSERG